MGSCILQCQEAERVHSAMTHDGEDLSRFHLSWCFATSIMGYIWITVEL